MHGSATRQGIWTPRWMLVHAATVILIVSFLVLGWWQVQRAASGNLLSYGYAIQWPAFAAFVTYVWIKEIRQIRASGGERQSLGPGVKDPGPARATASARDRASARNPAYDDSDDAELAAYNHYLAWRNANPHASRSEYPGLS